MKKVWAVILCGLALGLPASFSLGDAADAKIDLQALGGKGMPILLEFGRGWCIPCKHMKPILEDMSRVYEGRAVVKTVDMDANRELVRDFKIRMMPTLVFLLPNGKEYFRKEGILEREQISQVFTKMGVPQPSGSALGGVPAVPPVPVTNGSPITQGRPW